MSPAIRNRCFADVLTEDIIYQLARLEGLQVVARAVAAQTRGQGCSRWRVAYEAVGLGSALRSSL